MTPRVEAWLRQAEDDLAMADLACTSGFHAQACYHASQSAEKALKGLLIALDLEPPRSHALERLVERLDAGGIDTGAIRQLHLRALSRMSTTTRYPDGDEAPRDRFDHRDSDAAREIARGVLAFARRLVSE